MDLKKLLKKATDKVAEIAENNRPHNPQDDAIADLATREIKFDARDLDNLFFSAGGGYEETIKGDDIQKLQNARALFGHLKGQAPAEVVGYLTPTPAGQVVITVNGTPIDRLTKAAAKKTHPKLSGPTPVKISVSIIPNRDPKFDRPHLVLQGDNKPPKN
jgi:hypothetical protein